MCCWLVVAAVVDREPVVVVVALVDCVSLMALTSLATSQ
jgi:hypothetical protein